MQGIEVCDESPQRTEEEEGETLQWVSSLAPGSRQLQSTGHHSGKEEKDGCE